MRVAVTKMDSVTGFGVGEVYQWSVEYRVAPCTRGGSTGATRGMEGAKARVGGIELEIPFGAIENCGSPANLAIADRERVRIGLR